MPRRAVFHLLFVLASMRTPIFAEEIASMALPGGPPNPTPTLFPLTAVHRVPQQQQSSQIAGVVLDAESLAPLQGAQVTVEGTTLRSATDGAGRFQIQGLAGAETTLRVAAVGYQAMTQSVRVGDLKLRLLLQKAVVRLEEVTVTSSTRFAGNVSEGSTKLAQPLAETPQSITIISKDVLETVGAQNYFEVARYVSGVALQGQARYVRNYVSSRGFGLSDHRGFKLNGVNLIQRSVPDNVVIDRVEFIKGANAIAFGQNTPGGFLNVLTKSPPRDAEGYMSLAIGSFSRIRAEGDYGGPLGNEGNARYRLVGAYEQSEVFQRFQENKGAAVGGFVSADLGKNLTLNVDVAYHNKRATPHFGMAVFPDQTIPDLPSEFFPSYPWARVDYSFFTGVGRLSHSFGRGWTASLHGFRQVTDVDSRTATPLGDLAPANVTDPVTGNITIRRGDVPMLATAILENTDSKGGEIRLGGPVQVGGRTHRLMFTVEYMNQLFDRVEDEFFLRNASGQPIVFNYFQPDYTIREPDFLRTIPTGFDQKVFSSSAQVLLRPADRLTVTLGGRFDRIDETELIDDTPDEGFVNDRFTPRGSVMLGVARNLNAYYSYSESFEPSGELTCQDRLIGPKLGKQHEVGFKASFMNSDLLLTANAFTADLTNLTTGDTCGGEGIRRSRVAGKNRHKGVEFELIGQVTPAWNLIASFAQLDADRIEAPDPAQINVGIANVPPTTASVYSLYEFLSGPLKGLGIGGGLTYESAKSLTIPVIHKIPSYTQVDVHVYYTALRNIQIAATATNLNNAVGYDATFASTAIGNNRRPPRQFTLKVATAFGAGRRP